MFIEQAWKGDNTPWKVILTTLLCGGIFFISIAIFFLLPKEIIIEMYKKMSEQNNGYIGLIQTLFPFVFLLGLLFLLVSKLHNRSILSLTTSCMAFDSGRFFFSFFTIIFIALISFGIGYVQEPEHIVCSFNASRFFPTLTVAMVLLPLQIGFEEYFFRGFLMQQIGIAVRNKWFPLILTSALFGLCHAANPEVFTMGYGLLAYYIGIGLLLGIIVLMDEGLELSLGFHLANNLMAVVLLSFDFSALHTDSLFTYTGKVIPHEMLIGNLSEMLLSSPIILIIFAYKYKWTNWKQKLVGKVFLPKQNETNYESSNL